MQPQRWHVVRRLQSPQPPHASFLKGLMAILNSTPIFPMLPPRGPGRPAQRPRAFLRRFPQGPPPQPLLLHNFTRTRRNNLSRKHLTPPQPAANTPQSPQPHTRDSSRPSSLKTQSPAPLPAPPSTAAINSSRLHLSPNSSPAKPQLLHRHSLPAAPPAAATAPHKSQTHAAPSPETHSPAPPASPSSAAETTPPD